MNHSSNSTGFMLIFKDTNWDKNPSLTLEETDRIMARVMTWVQGLTQSGKATSGHPLHSHGVSISKKDGRTAVDGPFQESKEAIGGFLMLQVETFEEAVEIAKSNPMLDYGLTTEVRELAEECPVFLRARERLLQAA